MSNLDLDKIGKHVAKAVGLGQIENCISLLTIARLNAQKDKDA